MNGDVYWTFTVAFWLVAETFIWQFGWVGGLGWFEGTHRREFLRENMNGGRSTVPAITPAPPHSTRGRTKPEREHAETQVNPLEWQQKEALCFG